MITPPLALFDLAEAVGRWILWGLLSVVNALVVAIGTILGGLASLFPDLPDVPAPPSGSNGFIGALSWIYPWGGLLVLMASAVVIWVSFLGIKVIAKWVKAL